MDDKVFAIQFSLLCVFVAFIIKHHSAFWFLRLTLIFDADEAQGRS